MLNNTATGFDQEAALNYMKQKYGTVDTPGNGRRPGQRKESSEIQPVAKVRPKKEETEYSKQRSRRSTRNGGGGNRDTSPDFAAKKYEIVTVEDNRPLVEAIKELGMLHFRVNEPKKGGEGYILPCTINCNDPMYFLVYQCTTCKWSRTCANASTPSGPGNRR